MPIDILIGKNLDRVALLFVHAPKHDIQNGQDQNAADRAPFFPGQWLVRNNMGFLVQSVLIFRQECLSPEVERQTKHHSNSGGAKSIVPTIDLTQSSADERRKE